MQYKFGAVSNSLDDWCATRCSDALVDGETDVRGHVEPGDA